MKKKQLLQIYLLTKKTEITRKKYIKKPRNNRNK